MRFIWPFRVLILITLPSDVLASHFAPLGRAIYLSLPQRVALGCHILPRWGKDFLSDFRWQRVALGFHIEPQPSCHMARYSGQ